MVNGGMIDRRIHVMKFPLCSTGHRSFGAPAQKAELPADKAGYEITYIGLYVGKAKKDDQRYLISTRRDASVT